MRRASLLAFVVAALTVVGASVALANDRDCATAYPRMLADAERSRRSQDYADAADCAVALKRIDDAISLYTRALAADGFAPDDRHETLKSLAYQFEARERWKDAVDAWTKALVVREDGESRVGIVRTSLQIGDAARAKHVLSTVDPKSLSRPLKAEYWSLKSQILKESDPAAALEAANNAIAIEDAPYRRAERAELLIKLGRRSEAIADLQFAHSAEPSNASTALSLAYALNEEGRYREAIAMFEAAWRADPGTADYLDDWGYALLAARRREEAAAKFRQFVDTRSAQTSSPATDVRLWNANRQIKEIESDFYAFAFLTYRSNAGLPSALLTQQSALQSAFGAEVGWRAPFGLDRPGDLTFYASTYFALLDDLSIDRDSPQGAIGARWQPFAEHEFFLSLARLIELGDASREGWLAEVSFSASEGGDWNPGEARWFFASIAAYANYLLDEPHFFSAAVEAKLGETFALADLVALTPHLVLAGQTRDDNGAKSSLLEAGGGLALKHWFCDDHYVGPLCAGELTVQYRRVLAREGLGNGDNAVVATMALGL